MRVFLDANVMFSAAYSADGRTRALFALAGAGRCSLVSSAFAVDEARHNIALKRPDSLAELERLLRSVGIGEQPGKAELEWALTHGLPPKDAPILAAAAKAGADLLVTGDKAHFGMWFGRTLGGVCIVTPAMALARVLAGS